MNAHLAAISSKLDVLIELTKGEHAAPPPQDPLINLGELAALLDRHKRTVSRMRKERLLPEPAIGGRYPRWKKSAIDSWLSDRSSAP